MRYDPAIIKQHINQLKLDKELLEDEEAWLLSLESETDLIECLRKAEQKRVEAETNGVALDLEINKKKERQGRFERRDEIMRRLMFGLMQAAELKKLELPEATLSIRAGTSKVIISDETVIPHELCRIVRTPDKAKIKEALSHGFVTGATLSNAESVLSIRTK